MPLHMCIGFNTCSLRSVNLPAGMLVVYTQEGGVDIKPLMCTSQPVVFTPCVKGVLIAQNECLLSLMCNISLRSVYTGL